MENILKKMVEKYWRDWDQNLYSTLWAYITNYKTLTRHTSFSLVYGLKVVVPLEYAIPILQVAAERRMIEEESKKLQLNEVMKLEETRIHSVR